MKLHRANQLVSAYMYDRWYYILALVKNIFFSFVMMNTPTTLREEDFSTWIKSSRPKFQSWFDKTTTTRDINNNNFKNASNIIRLDINDLFFISFQQDYKRIYLSQNNFENEEFLKLMIYVIGIELANDMYSLLSNYNEQWCYHPDISKLRHVNTFSQILYFLYQQTQKYQLPNVYKKNLYKLLKDVILMTTTTTTTHPLLFNSIFKRWKIIYDCILLTSLNDDKFTIPSPSNIYINTKNTDIVTMRRRGGGEYLEYDKKFVQHFYTLFDKGNYIKYNYKKNVDPSLRLKLAVGVNKANTPFNDDEMMIHRNSKIIIQNILFI